VPDTPDISATVDALFPQLTRLSIFAALAIAATLVVAFGLLVIAHGAIDTGEDGFKAVAIIGGGGLALMVLAYARMRRAQEALVMPLVAQAVGLAYQKDAKGFLRSLPAALLPGNAQKTAEDYVSGRLGAHEIRMAEISVETGGKNSRTLFEGLVAEFHHQVPMPAFLLAPAEQTTPGLVFRAWIPTDDLIYRRDLVGSSGESHGLWTGRFEGEEPPALRPVTEAIVGIETRIAAPVTLFTAAASGTETYLALSHSRNLFRIGGFFPPRTKVLADVQIAAGDLSIALAIARELIAVEALVADTARPG
jgi:hypothetical protein